ncbi:HNH endonuclease family protein [Microbispora sp. NBC_01189]|uniref:HNH endonuclease family protein n=1 Tax=Microbispora sp. NBC_01189 TaxID=2903583 RepID=UPI002E1284CE|nr:HNH endonuclease family protein [Microbispora sp. NBC_01189]
MIAATAAALALLTGCGRIGDLAAEPAGQSGGGQDGGSGGSGEDRGVNPLDNPDGTGPGLMALTSGKEKAKARDLIGKVATKGRGAKTGYDRDKFGYAWADNVDGVPWGRNGCDTRNDMLKRDGENVEYRGGSNCVIVTMKLYDPYTGKKIDWSKSAAAKVQIDHVMPLSYDWQMGASRWSESKRKQIANDPLNLMPVDGSTNGSKGDSGPATWLPPRREIRCSYAVRFAQVSLKYDLPVTSADKDAMLEQCK